MLGCRAEEPMADKILAALDEQRKKFMQQIATIDIARAIYVSGLACLGGVHQTTSFLSINSLRAISRKNIFRPSLTYVGQSFFFIHRLRVSECIRSAAAASLTVKSCSIPL